jgi:hypothetical protein
MYSLELDIIRYGVRKIYAFSADCASYSTLCRKAI